MVRSLIIQLHQQIKSAVSLPLTTAVNCSCLLLQVGQFVLETLLMLRVFLASDLLLGQGLRRIACRGSGVRVSLAPFNRSPVSGWVFLLPMRGDDSARCPVLVQKDEALQALGAHLAKGAGLVT